MSHKVGCYLPADEMKILICTPLIADTSGGDGREEFDYGLTEENRFERRWSPGLRHKRRRRW